MPVAGTPESSEGQGSTSDDSPSANSTAPSTASPASNASSFSALALASPPDLKLPARPAPQPSSPLASPPGFSHLPFPAGFPFLPSLARPSPLGGFSAFSPVPTSAAPPATPVGFPSPDANTLALALYLERIRSLSSLYQALYQTPPTPPAH